MFSKMTRVCLLVIATCAVNLSYADFVLGPFVDGRAGLGPGTYLIPTILEVSRPGMCVECRDVAEITVRNNFVEIIAATCVHVLTRDNQLSPLLSPNDVLDLRLIDVWGIDLNPGG